MAGRYLATELQDENGDVIYPHTEADIVFTSDGTTVEENLGGEVTDADIQEIFGDSQVEAGKKLSVKEKIKKALKRYQTLLAMKVLDTVEEVEANTDAGYLMGAKAGAELINDLGGLKFGVDADGNYGYRKPGADTVTPFSNGIAEYIDGSIARKALSGSIASVSKSYTATSKGTLLVFCSFVYTGSYSDAVKLNGTNISPVSVKTAYQCRISMYSIPVEKEDKITVSVSSSSGSSNESNHAGYFMAFAK